MISEIVREALSLENIDGITSQYVLSYLFTILYSIQFYNKVQSKMLTMVYSNIKIKITKINVKC